MGELTEEERWMHMRLTDASFDLDGQLDRTEFIDLCSRVLWDLDIDNLEKATDNYIACKLVLKERANKMWKRTAARLDRQAGIVVPTLYAACMVFLFGLDLDDDYRGPMKNGQFQTMEEGLLTMTLRSSSIPGALVFAAVIVI